MSSQITGVAWYHEVQWEKLRNYSKDRTAMDKNYSDWLAGAEKAVKQLEAEGMTVHKVYIDVDMLIAWTKRKRLDIDGRSRADYVNHLLAMHHGLNSDV